MLFFLEKKLVDRNLNTLLNKMEGGDGPSAISSNPTVIKGNIYNLLLVISYSNNKPLFILLL